MAFRLCTIDPSAQFSQELTLTALARQVPPALVLAVLAAQDCATPRTRKLTLAATLYRVLCLHLFPRASVQHVFARLARGLRFVWPDDQLPLPGDSALCYRRYQLGARPLAALFHALRRPVATPTTRGPSSGACAPSLSTAPLKPCPIRRRIAAPLAALPMLRVCAPFPKSTRSI